MSMFYILQKNLRTINIKDSILIVTDSFYRLTSVSIHIPCSSPVYNFVSSKDTILGTLFKNKRASFINNIKTKGQRKKKLIVTMFKLKQR